MSDETDKVFTIRMPDVGEGVAEAELVEWHVEPGDMVREDQTIAAVMTDKATVEIPSSVTGKIIWLGGKVGDAVAVGADLVRISADPDAAIDPSVQPEAQAPAAEPAQSDASAPQAPEEARESEKPLSGAGESKNSDLRPSPDAVATPRSQMQRRSPGDKPLASPAVRRRALEAGADLRQVQGSGPAGRITHADLDAHLDAPEPQAAKAAGGRSRKTGITETPVVGLRRAISRKLSQTWTKVPHITIVEEVDVTALEELRTSLNAERDDARPRLTVLPFLVQALVRAVASQPVMNAHHDDEAGQLRSFEGVHVGIATQTPQGLKVPVVRHAEARTLDDTAHEIARVAGAARDNTALREELTGSTITITSLGALGAIATTPLINAPETAIVGVNRMAIRPVWDGTQFMPRKIMNLSSSFDHRVIDGWDAALFVKQLKSLLETPALIFVES